jgi:hypothetical protein
MFAEPGSGPAAEAIGDDRLFFRAGSDLDRARIF